MNTRCGECLSWTTGPVVDLDSRFAAQLGTVNKSMDEKLSAMSSALLSQFTVMLDNFKLGITNSSVSGNPGVPGIRLAKPSLCPSNILSAPRSNDSDFRMAERTRYLTDWA